MILVILAIAAGCVLIEEGRDVKPSTGVDEPTSVTADLRAKERSSSALDLLASEEDSSSSASASLMGREGDEKEHSM